jgi:hypothetical protein
LQTNHQRNIWLTNENWLAAEWRKREAAEREKERARDAAQEKANAKRRRQEDKEAKAEAKRQAALVYEESEWEPEWVGLPCCYVKSDGEVLLCGCNNKSKYSHLGTDAHKRFSLRFGRWKPRAVIPVSCIGSFKVLQQVLVYCWVMLLMAAKARVPILTAALQAVATQTKVA